MTWGKNDTNYAKTEVIEKKSNNLKMWILKIWND